MRLLKALSKWLHKYLGLLLLLFLMWMSISGILLNHPELISGLEVPGVLLPPQYRIENWQQGAFNKAVFPESQPGMAIVSGKQGVWVSTNAGRSFHSFMEDGYPASAYNRRTNDMILIESGWEEYIVACSYNGVWSRRLPDGGWKRAMLPEDHARPKKLLQRRGELLLVTESGILRSALKPARLSFTPMEVKKAGGYQVTMIRFFFDVHSGEILGLPGRLLIDAAGVICFILCFTALYTWYYPKKLKARVRMKLKGKRKNPRLFKFLLKYHLDFGIWSAAVLLILAFTGMFMRPPLLVMLAGQRVDGNIYPGRGDNPWEHQIKNAAYDATTGQILLDCRDGMWFGPADFSRPFRKITLPVPAFVMGATVMEFDSEGVLMLGSFNGLYKIHLPSGNFIDFIRGVPVGPSSNLQPGEFMVTGYMETPDGGQFISTFDRGLLHIGGRTAYGDFPMPRELQETQSMSLWHAMFELHNGRIFQDILGSWYILLMPLGALLTIILTLTGVVDWVIVYRRKARAAMKE